jgi:hypothetical protein
MSQCGWGKITVAGHSTALPCPGKIDLWFPGLIGTCAELTAAKKATAKPKACGTGCSRLLGAHALARCGQFPPSICATSGRDASLLPSPVRPLSHESELICVPCQLAALVGVVSLSCEPGVPSLLPCALPDRSLVDDRWSWFVDCVVFKVNQRARLHHKSVGENFHSLFLFHSEAFASTRNGEARAGAQAQSRMAQIPPNKSSPLSPDLPGLPL